MILYNCFFEVLQSQNLFYEASGGVTQHLKAFPNLRYTANVGSIKTYDFTELIV